MKYDNDIIVCILLFINRLGIAFLKNCNLKKHKIDFSNRRQGVVFLKTRNFKS
jgi:hypothetical protein